MTNDKAAQGVLAGLRVLDCSHMYAGSFAGCLLADLGAEVIAVEHPTGSPLRTMLPRSEGQSVWWKAMGRGKQAITLKLSDPRAKPILIDLLADADVMIENFRPGTLEKWGLGPSDLEAAGVDLVMLRISGFGQTGPYSQRPGYGTIAEAMSGLANLTGFADGPPMFPSASLADGVAGLFGAFGALAATFARREQQHTSGVEVIDVALFETLFRLIPTQVLIHDQLGETIRRPGNFLGSHGVLRNLYECKDGTFFCISAIGQAPISRVFQAIGADDLDARLRGALEERGGNTLERLLEEGNDRMTEWAEQRPYSEVAEALAATDAVFERVFSMDDIAADEQYRSRKDIVAVPDVDLGEIRMPAPTPKFSRHQHTVLRAGAPLGAETDTVLRERAGLSPETIDELRKAGVV